MYRTKAAEIAYLKKTMPRGMGGTITAENLAKLGMSPSKKGGQADYDMVSQFSALTQESELLATENALLLRINGIEYYKGCMDKALGLRDPMPSSI